MQRQQNRFWGLRYLGWRQQTLNRVEETQNGDQASNLF